MAASPEFTVNGDSNPDTHTAEYGATVSLELVSASDVNSIAWSIVSSSKPDQTLPTITPSGSPSGKTATFTMPSDPGDGQGRMFRVRCRVTGTGGISDSHGVVGKANIVGIYPVCLGEELDRHATYGWAGVINEALAAIGGGGGGGGGAGGGGFNMTFSTSTTDSDPGPGVFRFDNATLGSVTKVYVDLLAYGGEDITDWLAAIDDSVGTTKGYFWFRSLSDDSVWGQFRLTGRTAGVGYDKFNLTLVDSGSGGLPSTEAGGTSVAFDALGRLDSIVTADITANNITDALLRQSAACSLVGRSANSTGNVADITASTNNRVFGRKSDALSFFQVDMTTDITGVTPIANGGTNLSAIGGNGTYLISDGSGYIKVGPKTASDLTNADATVNPGSAGAQAFLRASTLSTTRNLTLGVTGSPRTYSMFTVYRLDTTANTYVVKSNAAVTLFTFPASTAAAASFAYDGADWIFVSSWDLVVS